LLSICELFEVEEIDKAKILNALADETFSDFEDCLQKECAAAFQANYIVTRNCADFKSSGMILSILVYTFFSRMFDLMLPPVAKHSIVVA
jgi:hypothetical protein